MLCQIILTPWEAKRLIAKAVVQLPEIQYALTHGIVSIARGTTTSYIVEELVNSTFKNFTFKKENYCIGCIVPDRLCMTQEKTRLPEIAVVKGELKEVPSKDIIKEMGPRDVFIKSANAVDCNFEAAILLGSPVGGTIGSAIGAVYAKGITFVIPVGLEKLIPYPVKKAFTYTGNNVDFSMGMSVGLFPVLGNVVTEIQALEQYGVTAVPIAGGGCNGAEGSTVLSIQGDTDTVNHVLQLVKSIKGEPPLKMVAGECKTCNHSSCPWTG
jgi:hypothetical protein